MEGKGIRIKGIQELAHQGMSLPLDNVDQRNFLHIFVKTIKLITSKTSCVVKKLEVLAETIIFEEEALEDFRIQDTEFYTKLCFYINNRV